MLTVGRGLLVGIWSWFWGPFVSPEIPGRWNRVLILMVIIAPVMLSFLWLDRINYFASLWHADLSKGLVDYVRAICAAPRVAYIEAGVQYFQPAPVVRGRVGWE